MCIFVSELHQRGRVFARFVRIRNGQYALSLSQVVVTRVWGLDSAAENIAQGKRVTASREPFGETRLDSIVDGSMSESRPHDSTALFMIGANQWVMIDLAEQVQIDSVTVITAQGHSHYPVDFEWTLELSVDGGDSAADCALPPIPFGAASRLGYEGCMFTFSCNSLLLFASLDSSATVTSTAAVTPGSLQKNANLLNPVNVSDCPRGRFISITSNSENLRLSQVVVTRVGGGSVNIAKGKHVIAEGHHTFRGQIQSIVDGDISHDRSHLGTFNAAGLWLTMIAVRGCALI